MAKTPEFHRRIGNISMKKEVILMEPTQEEWVLGDVVVLKVSFTTNRASFIPGDTILMEKGCAARFIDKNFARPETDAEREAAIAAGFARGFYPADKPAPEKKAAKKAKKPEAKADPGEG